MFNYIILSSSNRGLLSDLTVTFRRFLEFPSLDGLERGYQVIKKKQTKTLCVLSTLTSLLYYY